MHERDQKRLRATFDEAAQLYDRARPGYPPEVCEDFVQLAGIGTGSRVLEIGAGTGQVTVPLAERGCQIVAVELGANMAAILRRKVSRFPSVTVVVSAFEDWPLPGEPFDAVISATAFHWIDPKVRVTKVIDALRPDGALALISAHHILGGDKDFFREVQTCYELYDPTTSPGLRLPTTEQIPAGTEEFESSGQFGPMFTRRYERTLTYSTAEYLDLLLTYSGHRALAPEARAHLFACIAHLIDSRYGGRVRKRYLFELQVAHLRSDGAERLNR